MSDKLDFRGTDKESNCMVFSDKIGLGPFFELVDDGRITNLTQLACLDKNGNKVYAGDKVKYKFPNWKNRVKHCYVTELRPPFYGYGLTADDDTDFTAEGFYSSQIELIKD